jgi:hypothetical protein
MPVLWSAGVAGYNPGPGRLKFELPSASPTASAEKTLTASPLGILQYSTWLPVVVWFSRAAGPKFVSAGTADTVPAKYRPPATVACQCCRCEKRKPNHQPLASIRPSAPDWHPFKYHSMMHLSGPGDRCCVGRPTSTRPCQPECAKLSSTLRQPLRNLLVTAQGLEPSRWTRKAELTRALANLRGTLLATSRVKLTLNLS